jgi:hypothetical protein
MMNWACDLGWRRQGMNTEFVRPKRRWVDNIKIDIEEIAFEVHVQWQTLVLMLLNIQVIQPEN